MDILLPVVSVIRTIQQEIADDMKLEGEVKNKFEELLQEMRLITGFIKNYRQGGKHGLDGLIAELQNLAYDIEDFKDLHDHKPKSSLLGRVFFMDTRQEDIKRMDSFMGRVAKLREWMVWIEGLKDDGSRLAAAGGVVGEAPRGEPDYAALDARARIRAPVGMEEHLRALSELLAADDNAEPEPEPGQLRVVSVVGCRGVGKTTLAWGLYQRRDSLALGGQLGCCAWVEMKAPQGSEADARSLLTDIIRQVSSQHAAPKDEAVATTDDVNRLCTTLHGYLQGYRYFIVIDDLRDWEVWENVKSAFPNDTSSIIVVTTSFQSVATACSSSSYVYKLKGLDTNGCSRLLWDNVIGESSRHKKYNLHPDLENYFKEIIRKCDGLPMAVLSVAKFLRRKQHGRSPDVKDCKEAIRLSKHLSKGSDPDFREMQRVLDESYEDLPNYNLKTCLLSISMFPHGHQIKIKSLERRWMAEGLVARTDDDVVDEELDTAYDALKELVNRSIIEPVQDGSMVNLKAEVKRCLVHGVMLEYLVGKSISRNYVCLIKDGKILFNKEESSSCPTRRLSVHDTTVVTDAKMLGQVRSLTIVEKEEEPAADADADADAAGRSVDRRGKGAAPVPVPRSPPLRRLVDYIQGCKLLRVLDIHKCRGVDDNVLRRICDLQLLRYLSLRGTDARKLPKQIGRLRDLETLDVRDLQMSEPMDLPLEAILLPRLVYLFGKLKLPDDLHKSKAAKGGQLHTLAGFVVTKKKNQSFAYILNRKHTSRLRKLKIWWTEDEDMPNDLSTQLMESLQQRSSGTNHLESLSLDFGDRSLEFLEKVSPTVPWTISTIKLRGKLSKLPGFINGKNSLSEVEISQLHLLHTGLGCQALSILQRLPKLKYLKIVEVDGTVDDGKEEVDSAAINDFGKGVFKVEDGGFPFLEGLFIEATRLPKMTIGSNAMQQLITLELHCTDVSGFQVAAIENLGSLAHVVLKPSPIDRAAWKAAAKNNINCPRVEFL